MPQGRRAKVRRQVVREHTYAFSAVCPLSGEVYSVMSPVCNTEAMNELLGGLSTHYRGEDIVLVADAAGWHQSGGLSVPQNIRLQLLPPYSPELNPVEHLWDYIREQKRFNNYVFESLDQLEDHLEKVLKELNNEKDYIRSLCTFNWMINAP